MELAREKLLLIERKKELGTERKKNLMECELKREK